MHIVQINQWISVDIESRAFKNVPNADITGNMTSNDYFLQLQNYIHSLSATKIIVNMVDFK